MLNPEIYSLNLSNFTHFYHHCVFCRVSSWRLRNLTVYRLWAKNGAWFGEPSWHSDVAMFLCKKNSKIYSDSPIFTGKRMQTCGKESRKKIPFFPHFVWECNTWNVFLGKKLTHFIIYPNQIRSSEPSATWKLNSTSKRMEFGYFQNVGFVWM